MVFKSGGGDAIDPQGDTEAWNVAPYFTASAIGLPLKELNDLEDTARFGSSKMDEDLIFSDDIFTKRRAEAVKRYQQKLRQIISDTKFKVKKNDVEKTKVILATVNNLRSIANVLLSSEEDMVSHQSYLKIDEPLLNRLMDKLVVLKEEYLAILNKAGLIFRESTELDLDKLQNDFIQGG